MSDSDGTSVEIARMKMDLFFKTVISIAVLIAVLVVVIFAFYLFFLVLNKW